jgi:hypothetical protein
MQNRLRPITMMAVSFFIFVSLVLPESAKSQEGLFAKVVANALRIGDDNHLSKIWCQSKLGLTGPDGQACPTKQTEVDFGTGTGDDRYPAKLFDVGTDAASGQTKVVIWYRTKTEGTFYVTSAAGELEKSFYADPKTITEVPLSPAVRSDFEKEKAFWVQKLSRP